MDELVRKPFSYCLLYTAIIDLILSLCWLKKLLTTPVPTSKFKHSVQGPGLWGSLGLDSIYLNQLSKNLAVAIENYFVKNENWELF